MVGRPMRRWHLQSGQVDTQAVDAIQLEIRRSAYRVGWVDWRLDQLLEREHELKGELDGDQVTDGTCLELDGPGRLGMPRGGGQAAEDLTEGRTEGTGGAGPAQQPPVDPELVAHRAEQQAERLAEVRSEMRWWMRESRAERKHLVEVSGAAVRAGLVKHVISALELERETVSRVLLAALNALELTEEQKLLAVASMYAEVEKVAHERREKVIQGELLGPES